VSALKTCPQCGSEYELDVKFCPKDGSTLRVPAGGNLVGSVIADRYHVLSKLGEGGMGQVYLAEHVKMGRKSAIKLMNPSMSNDPDAIGRFNREAANASRIAHNNVAAIYDFGETADGLIYLAMEYIEGEPLTKVMERTGALPPDRAADIARQVAEALNAAHEIGIVHRDLKPDNIMIARSRDGADVVKVVDFGIAKAQGGEGQKVTKTGLVVGTPEYMSPEQLAGDQVDGRSDIYTLGLVTFHMLTGTLPFPSSTLQESMIMRLTDRPRTLAEMKPDSSWPAPLQTVLDRALQRKAEDRYQRATDFASDLVRAVKGMPPSVGAPVGATAAGVAAAAGAGAPAMAGGSTVPPTRVRSGGVPTPPTSGAIPAVAASKSHGGLLVAGLGIGALVVGVAAWMMLGQRRAAHTAAGDSTSKPPVVAMADTATPAGTRGAGSDTTAASRAATTSPGPETTAQGGATPDQGAGRPPLREAPRRVQRFQRPEPLPGGTGGNVAPPAQSPTTSATGNAANTASVSAPSGSSSPAVGPENDFQGELTADRARAAVTFAADLINRKQPDRALRVLARAIKSLPTGNDSVTAFYHVSEALLERAEFTNNEAPRKRACAILSSLRSAQGSTYYESINFMYGQYCK